MSDEEVPRFFGITQLENRLARYRDKTNASDEHELEVIKVTALVIICRQLERLRSYNNYIPNNSRFYPGPDNITNIPGEQSIN